MSGWQRAEFFRRMGYFQKQGDGCYFANYNFGTEPWLLSFGDNVYIAAEVKFITHDVSCLMVANYLGKPDQLDKMGAIRVGNNVFVGLGTIILPGVEIGDRVVVGAGAVVTRSLESDGIYAGNPAVRVGDFESYCRRLEQVVEHYPWRLLLGCDKQKNLPEINRLRRRFFADSDATRR